MRVSIITIVYNNVSNILDCINSVKEQDYRDIEYIVIDGKSDDGTNKIIQQNRDVIDIYRSESDKGLYDALNKGISLATGDIIGVLHSDDLFFESNTITKIVDAFSSNNSDIVYANGIYVDGNDISKIKRIYPSNDYKRKFLYFGWIPLHTTIWVKRGVFEKFGLYRLDYSIASDYDISLRWFKEDSLIKTFLNDTVVKMRIGGKSTTISLQKTKSLQDYKIIKEHKLCGVFTLLFKIIRKIPQYLAPYFSNVLQTYQS